MVVFNEYQFAKGDKITELFRMSDVESLRRQFEGDCFSLAYMLANQLRAEGVLASIVTFRSQNPVRGVGISVWSDFVKGYVMYSSFHTVVLLGDCVIDMLHTNKLIQTSEYVNKLKDSNPRLRVDQSMSGVWYTAAGYERPIELECLLSGNWG